MEIKQNISLAPYTTFNIGGAARYFCLVKDQFDAHQAFEFAREKNLPHFILGGGSNLLVSDAGFEGLVVKVNNQGIEIAHEDAESVTLKIAAGEVWDKVVEFSVKNGWWGIENLSHIPGSAGAIAVQNVGAYGQEASQVLVSVTAYDIKNHAIIRLLKSECGFGYRQSIFNTTETGRFIIFELELRLQKNLLPNLTYRDLAKKFEGQNPNLEEIRQAVIEIRDKKYPYPDKAVNGNAGSFFKNPVLNAQAFLDLKQKIQSAFGDAASQTLEDRKFSEQGQIKVPAAFLMELLGLKGMQVGSVKINPTQPLVILNVTGKAKASEVLNLARLVITEVKHKFNLTLKIEPCLLGFNSEETKEIISVL
jgi:UDP-N-acetylmuramate dehydrogenase